MLIYSIDHVIGAHIGNNSYTSGREFNTHIVQKFSALAIKNYIDPTGCHEDEIYFITELNCPFDKGQSLSSRSL